MQLPEWTIYCDNTTEVNALCFDLGNRLRVWFSYRTPVAYYTPASGCVVRQNDWQQTTGKHLNAIDNGDKKSRIPGPQFEEQLARILDP